jgi:hypothetical protein
MLFIVDSYDSSALSEKLDQTARKSYCYDNEVYQNVGSGGSQQNSEHLCAS